MEIRIGALGDDAQEALQSLQTWLVDDRDVAINAKIVPIESRSEPGSMTSDIEAISLIVSSAFNLANLTLAYLTWRSAQVAPPAPVRITVNAQSIVVSDTSPETAACITSLLESGKEGA